MHQYSHRADSSGNAAVDFMMQVGGEPDYQHHWRMVRVIGAKTEKLLEMRGLLRSSEKE